MSKKYIPNHVFISRDDAKALHLEKECDEHKDITVIDINNTCNRCQANRDSEKYISCMNTLCDIQYISPE